jgi:hypothetical protein
MSKDLEEFLKKAAERRQKRQQSGGVPASTTSKPEVAPVPQATIAQEKPRENQPPHETLGPRIQSHIHPSSLLTKEIDQADDRMRERIHSQFDHSVSSIDQGRTTQSKDSQADSSSGKKKASKSTKKQIAPPQANAISSFEESRNDMTIERSASKMINPDSMLELLRDPQTLRTAFIASQIFERKF